MEEFVNESEFSAQRHMEFHEVVKEVQRYGYLCERCMALRERHPDWADVEFPLIHAIFHPEQS